MINSSCARTRLRPKLLTGTALISLSVLLLMPGTAYATCDVNFPAMGATATCTTVGGTDTTGVIGAANNVTANINANAIVETIGIDSVLLGTGATINLDTNAILSITLAHTNGNTVRIAGGDVNLNGAGATIRALSSNSDAIRLNGSGSVTMAAGTFITANAFANQDGIVFGGGAGQAQAVTIGGTIAVQAGSVAINGGAGDTTLTLLSTGSVTGNVIASAASFNDIFILGGAVDGAFSANSLGAAAQYRNFDTFQKTGASNWTLSGTGTQNWDLQAGTLTGDTTSIQGNVANAGTLAFDQAATGTYAGNITGTGALTKLGTGTVTLTGTNTYSGGTTITAGTLAGSAADLQGDITNNATLRFSSGGTYADVISGTGAVEFTSGTTVLTGTNTYTGNNLISAGTTVSINADAALGNAANTTTISSAELRLDNAFSSARNFSTAGTAGFNTNGSDNTLSGIISGAGRVVKSGAGTLTLSGANTHTGGNTISAGTLSISADNNLGGGAGNVVLNNGGTLELTSGFTSTRAFSFGAGAGTIDTGANTNTFSGVFSGTGGFAKIGTGTLNLSNTNTYTGTTAVNAGTLNLTGSIANSITTIGAAGTLTGTGTTGALTVNGTLAPGVSGIGTTNVTGNLIFNPGSTYTVETDPGGTRDQTLATGAITLNGGTLSVQPGIMTYAGSTDFTILQGASVAGTFDTLTNASAFLTASLTYNAANVVLTVAPNSNPFAAEAADEGQRGVAAALDGLGTGNLLYDSILPLSGAQAQQAFDALSGEHIAGIGTAIAQSTTVTHNVLNSRMQNLTVPKKPTINLNDIKPAAGDREDEDPSVYTAALMTPPPAKPNIQFWSEGFGTFGHTEANNSGSAQDRTSGGILLGADKKLENGAYVGAYAGYEMGHIESDTVQSSSDVETWHAGLYGAKVLNNGLRISGNAGAMYHDISTTRYIDFVGYSAGAIGSTHGASFTASAEIAKPLNWEEYDLDIEPFAGAGFSSSVIKGYEEVGARDANLVVDTSVTNTPTTTLGMRIKKKLTLKSRQKKEVTVKAKIGWQHAYGDLDDKTTVRFAGGNTNFTANGPGRTRDSALVGLGLEADLPIGGQGYANYEGNISGHARDHNVSAGAKWGF